MGKTCLCDTWRDGQYPDESIHQCTLGGTELYDFSGSFLLDPPLFPFSIPHIGSTKATAFSSSISSQAAWFAHTVETDNGTVKLEVWDTGKTFHPSPSSQLF